jgi:hypothetical protein
LKQLGWRPGNTQHAWTRGLVPNLSLQSPFKRRPSPNPSVAEVRRGCARAPLLGNPTINCHSDCAHRSLRASAFLPRRPRFQRRGQESAQQGLGSPGRIGEEESWKLSLGIGGPSPALCLSQQRRKERLATSGRCSPLQSGPAGRAPAEPERTNAGSWVSAIPVLRPRGLRPRTPATELRGSDSRRRHCGDPPATHTPALPSVRTLTAAFFVRADFLLGEAPFGAGVWRARHAPGQPEN